MNYQFRNTVLPFVNATFITGLLLLIMYSMVKVGDPELQAKVNIKLPAMRLPDRDEKPIIDIVKPVKPEQAKETPELVEEIQVVDIDPVKSIFQVGDVIDRDQNIDNGPINSQLILAFSLPPHYPRIALERGVEGFVVVGFDVDENGAVVNPFVAEANPPKIFNRSAINAIQRFKYKPKQVDGKFVKTQGLQYMFTFKLDS